MVQENTLLTFLVHSIYEESSELGILYRHVLYTENL